MKKTQIWMIALSVLLVALLIVIYLIAFSHKNNKYDFTSDSNIATEQTMPPTNAAKASDEIAVEREIESIKNASSGTDVIVSVGKYNITRADFEIKKLQNSILPSKHTEKDALIELITNKVLDIEAERRNIVISDDEINDYVENIKKSMNDNFFNSEYISSYIASKGITREEFIDEEIAKNRQAAPSMLRRSRLGEEINKEYKDTILKKATDSNTEPAMTAKQYYENYKLDLLKKADIKFYDSELEKLFSK